MAERVVVSPHLDDAVLSVGGTLAKLDGPTRIVTVLAGFPRDPITTAYDRQCGFDDSDHARRVRLSENERAGLVLGGDVITENLRLLDRQYGKPASEDEIVAALAEVMPAAGNDEWWVPLGIQHADHVAVAHACMRLWSSFGFPTLYVYEELPYRVWFPEFAVQTIEGLGQGAKVERIPEPETDQQLKAAAVACYRSQFGDVADPSLFVPERIWKVTR